MLGSYFCFLKKNIFVTELLLKPGLCTLRVDPLSTHEVKYNLVSLDYLWRQLTKSKRAERCLDLEFEMFVHHR